eukprot:363484-Chlamydomonas_euryale.AAC.5
MWISSLLNWLPDDLAPPLEHAWVIEHGKDLAEARRRQLPPGVRAHALVTSYDMVQKVWGRGVGPGCGAGAWGRGVAGEMLLGAGAAAGGLGTWLQGCRSK